MLLMYKFYPLAQGTYAIMNTGATGRLPPGWKASFLALKIHHKDTKCTKIFKKFIEKLCVLCAFVVRINRTKLPVH
jgi:hypothetical protein